MVHAVAPRDRSQPREIQMGVLDFQRIERPFQQLNALLDCVFPLRQFQLATQPMVTKRVAPGGHVRVQVGMTGPAAGNGKRKSYELAAMEGADGLATDLLADDKHAQRHQVDIVKIPDLFLQGDAGLELLHAGTFADGNLICPGYGGAQNFGSSCVLACCQRASISSSVASSRVRPCSRSFSSSQLKRRRNFLLVLRRADSGSTER